MATETRKPPAFQFYVTDWLGSKSVRFMSPVQRGYYIQLMAEAWDSDPIGTLPNDPDGIWRHAGAKSKKQFDKDGGDFVVAQFVIRGDVIMHPRLLSERKKQIEWRKKCSNGGKAKAAKRLQVVLKHKGSTATADAVVEVKPIVNGYKEAALQSSVSSLQSSPLNQKPTPKSERASRLPDDFCVTPDHRYFALANDLPPPDDHIAEFRDHWIGIPGQRGTKLDWNAAFRNWLRKAKQFQGPKNERKAQVNQDQQRDDFQRMAAAANGKSSLETAVPKQRLLAHVGGKERGDGGLEGIGKADGEGEIH